MAIFIHKLKVICFWHHMYCPMKSFSHLCYKLCTKTYCWKKTQQSHARELQFGFRPFTTTLITYITVQQTLLPFADNFGAIPSFLQDFREKNFRIIYAADNFLWSISFKQSTYTYINMTTINTQSKHVSLVAT